MMITEIQNIIRSCITRLAARLAAPFDVVAKRYAISLLFLVLAAPTSSQAAFVTTNEAGMDAIFSQASFGPNPIDIRFNPTVILVRPDLLTISSQAELDDLFSLSPSGSPVVNMFFVDNIQFCEGFNDGFLGCATLNGNDIVVESDIAAGIFGTELNAHELGHNLNLAHGGPPPLNLMNPGLNGTTTLTTTQVNAILGSSLVQSQVGLPFTQRFIEITPVLLVAVPLPGALPLAASAIFVLGFFTRRRPSRRS